MEEAAENLEFERAARIRDRLAAIKRMGDRQKVVALKVPEQDIIALAQGPERNCFEVFRFMNGRLCDRENTGTCANAPAGPASASGAEELYLFTTKTCPNCKIAKNELEKAGLAYQVMDVAEHMDLVNEYGIQQAPTLIVRHGDQVEKLVNASVIKKYAATHE